MMYFPRMLDKIRLNARGELGEEYLENLGAQRAADGACCNFLRVDYAALRERVLQGGSDDDILKWCYENGRRLNEGDIAIWNGFVSKIGWRDFATPRFNKQKQEQGLAHRDDIMCVLDLMEVEEGRAS
jgi:gluconokinase